MTLLPKYDNRFANHAMYENIVILDNYLVKKLTDKKKLNGL